MNWVLKIKIANKLYRFLLLNLCICIISLQYSNFNLVSITYYLFIILNFLIFCISLNNKSNFSDYLKIIIVLSVFLVFQIILKEYFGIIELASVFGFLSLFFVGFYSPQIILDFKLLRLFKYLLIFLTANNLFIFNTADAYRDARFIESDIIYGSSLTLGFANPNTTASILLILTILNLFLLKYEFKKAGKLLLFLTFLLNLYFLLLTDSRTSFFTAIIFSVVYFFQLKPKFNLTRILFVLLSGFVFVFVYFFMFIYGIGINWEILGKPFFSGRQEYLVEIFYDGLNYPFFGNPEKYGYNNHLSGMLSIFLSGGFMILLIFLTFFTKYINRLYLLSPQYNYAAFAILIVFLQTISEGNFIITGTYFSALFSILFVFANAQIQLQNNINVSK